VFEWYAMARGRPWCVHARTRVVLRGGVTSVPVVGLGTGSPDDEPEVGNPAPNCMLIAPLIACVPVDGLGTGSPDDEPEVIAAALEDYRMTSDCI
jgi:hypothetical protein